MHCHHELRPWLCHSRTAKWLLWGKRWKTRWVPFSLKTAERKNGAALKQQHDVASVAGYNLTSRTNRSIGWLIDLIDLIDWLIDWSYWFDRLIDWLIDWLVDRSTDWRLIGWLKNRVIDWSFGRLIDWSVVWLLGWLIVNITGRLLHIWMTLKFRQRNVCASVVYD